MLGTLRTEVMGEVSEERGSSGECVDSEGYALETGETSCRHVRPPFMSYQLNLHGRKEQCCNTARKYHDPQNSGSTGGKVHQYTPTNQAR